MTARALKVIAGADYVLGNALYLEPLEPLLSGKNVISSSMGKEVERAKQAIDLACSHAVAIVSGGDAGVYGMASIVLEVLEHSGADIEVEVIPGVTAANAAASRIGSPAFRGLCGNQPIGSPNPARSDRATAGRGLFRWHPGCPLQSQKPGTTA